MAALNKFDSFLEAVAEKKHNLGSDTIKWFLTNEAPQASDTVKSDIAELSGGNGYTAGGNVSAITSSSTSAGVYKMVIGSPDPWVASGGPIGPFRYAVAYNDTAASDELIGWYDRGESITLQDGESFELDLSGQSNGLIQLAWAA